MTLTGHVTLPCEEYIFIFDNGWGMFSWCSGWMQGWHASGCRCKNFFWLKWLKTFLHIQKTEELELGQDVLKCSNPDRIMVQSG